MSNNLSSVQQGESSNTLLKYFAWGAVLLVCIPQLIYRAFDRLLPGEPTKPYWLAVAEVVILAVLCLVTWLWSRVKPLRGFLFAILAYNIAIFLLQPLTMTSDFWKNWMDKLPWGVWMVVDRLGTHFFPILLMTLTLIGSGVGRKELFLIRGNLNALGKPTPLLLIKENDNKTWPLIIRNVLVVVVISLLVVLSLQLQPNLRQIRQVLVYLPAIIIGATINALAEEYELRSVFLARLLPVLGKQQPIFITSVLFGLLHFFGNPGSIPGVLMAAYLGYISAKSMVETGGIFWAFLIHFVGDVIIYAFWAM